MNARISPAQPPFPADVQAWLERVMPPGRQPLRLFTTLARDPRLFQRFFAGGLLDRGNLTLRQRELVIWRTTALHGSEYEWGVHVALFGARLGLNDEQHRSLVGGSPDDPCWPAEDRLLLQMCDDLYYWSTVAETTFESLRAQLGELAVLELLMLSGFYTTVSYLANALALPLEPGTAGFPSSSVRPHIGAA